MERISPRRRPKPAAIDITWVSCRGVRSSLPFHTPCLYASVFVAPSSARGVHGHRRPHRVKTPTDRAGGANPEWDAPLRIYLPVPDASPSPADEAAGRNSKNKEDGDDDDVLLLRFEIKAEVAVLGDKLTASAAVPIPALVADGQTRRVSYQLAGPDGRQRNGVISFSYAFHDRNGGDDDDDGHSSDGGSELVVSPPAFPTSSSSSPSTSSPVAHPPPPTTAAPRLYPAIEWTPAEQIIPIYPPPPPPVTAAEAVVTNSRYYPPPVEPVAVYPPSPETASSCSVYPPSAGTASSCSVYPPPVGETVPANGLYPTVDLAPVSCYPPAVYGVECGCAVAPPVWDGRCLYG